MKGTIKSSSEMALLFERGRRINTASILALVLETDNSLSSPPSGSQNKTSGRIAVVAGKRLGSAPQRSTAKRKIREAARLAGFPRQGFDIVFVARDALLSAEFSKIRKDMDTIAARMEKK
ncbi:MAG: ribonuclease P protein component [Coriobacteriia bacterium]|nr:ribonuclease P protein component [Coriobacteriia bacterium]